MESSKRRATASPSRDRKSKLPKNSQGAVSSPNALAQADDKHVKNSTVAIHALAQADDQYLQSNTVDALVQILSELEAGLSPVEALDPTQKCRTDARKALQKPAAELKPETVIGVIGDTGVGKSSLINGLLDFENIAPASGNGSACTAVATEFRYADDENTFKARVEYVTMDEFLEEARQLLLDIINGENADAEADRKNHKKLQKPSNEARAAWERIQSIFPSLTKEDLSLEGWQRRLQSSSADTHKLALSALRSQTQKELSHLGTEEEIIEEDEEAFAECISSFVSTRNDTVAVTDLDDEDEDEKDGENEEDEDKEDEDKEEDEGEGGSRKTLQSLSQSDRQPGKGLIWPIIKTFRIYLHSDVLKSGVVLVDLPGQHDANEARSRVADRYQQACSAVLVVQAAARALDSKSLKAFLDGDLKRRLEMDGLIGNMTLVCTKADDSEARKAVKELPASDPMKARLEDNFGLITDIQHDLRALRKERKELKSRLEKLRKGKNLKRDHKKEISEAQSALEALDDQLTKNESEQERLERENEWNVIQARNERLKKMLGLKVKTPNGDPVTVFTVSSQEYQYLKGRFNSDLESKKFLNGDDTEIPALRAHISNYGIQRRANATRGFINHSLRPILSSLKLLCLLDRDELSARTRSALADLVNANMKNLKAALATRKEQMLDELIKCVTSVWKVAEKFEMPALKQARGTIEGWRHGAPTARGIHWITFSACVRRRGVFGSTDLNMDLLRPMYDAIAKPWTDALQVRVPEIMSAWATDSGRLVRDSHEAFTAEVQGNTERLHAWLVSIRTQVSLRADAIQLKCTDEVAAGFKASARELNRGLETMLLEQLQETYAQAERETGIGRFDRMIAAFQTTTQKTNVFKHCRTKLTQQLNDMVTGVVQNAEKDCLRPVVQHLDSDYRVILVKRQHLSDGEIATVKGKTIELLKRAEAALAKLLKDSRPETSASRAVPAHLLADLRLRG